MQNPSSSAPFLGMNDSLSWLSELIVFCMYQFNLYYSTLPMLGCRGINKSTIITKLEILVILFAVQMKAMACFNPSAHQKFYYHLMKSAFPSLPIGPQAIIE